MHRNTDQNALSIHLLTKKWYPQKDYHTMYILEIEKILVRE